MRNMPAPGEADSGGNPLQEGILGGQDGGWQQPRKRDESFASVHGAKDIDPDIEIPAEIIEVAPPDADSLRPDKKRMDKKADFLGDMADFGADVALPVAGGTAGFLVGGPAGAAAGAALGAGAGNLTQGDDLGEATLNALPYAIPGGVGGIGARALTGTAAKAAAGGTTRGGLGSLMKSAWGKVPTGKIRDAYLMHSALGDANNMTSVQPGASMPAAAPAPTVPSGYYSAQGTSTPSSQDHIPSNNTDDPEQVDFHERNDGAHKGLAGEQGVNDIGGSDTGPDGLFAADSPALQAITGLLPKLLQFALSDQPGADDPEIQGLHQAIEAEQPGYMNDANDEHGTKLVMMLVKGDQEEGGDDLLQDNDEPHDPIAEHQATALKPGLESVCPTCGGTIDASMGKCAQCGSKNDAHAPQPTNPGLKTPQQMMVAKTAADSQGPHTDEQKAIVAEYLQQNGRGEEVPNMILEPWKYADELAELTGKDDPPEDIGEQAPPPPVDPNQQGEMPVPPMTAPPGGAPPGAGAMMASIAKYASTVDSVAEPCPNCGSHSTGYVSSEDGKCNCKTCGHDWEASPLIDTSKASAFKLAEEIPVANEPSSPVDDQPQEGEPQDQGSHTWVDVSGAPLKVGRSYEMYSQNYDIPDHIRIDAVKPEVIEYTITGDYGLDHGTELTHEEASIENVTFQPSEGDGDIQPEDDKQNMEDIARPSTGMDETDLSTPHLQMASVTADFDDINGPAGPNIDPVLLANEHARGLHEGKPQVGCPHCVNRNTLVDDTLRDLRDIPTTEHPLGPATGSRTTSHDIATGDAETGPDWLMEEGNSDEDFYAGMDLTKTAGQKFTPYQQRDFIDEDGVARNSDKLNLGGTHYEAAEIEDQFLFGL